MSTDALPSSQDLFYEGLISSYVDLPRFIAREWIWQRVQAALNQPHCRFVLLTAEPGAGKSAFMAWVARNHPKWPRYFIRRDQRTPLEDGGARGFLEKIGFQLSAIFPEVFQTDAVRLSVSQDVGLIGTEGRVTGAEVDRLIATPFYAKAVDIIQQVKANQGNILGIHVRELVTDPNRISLRDLQRMALLAPAMALERLGRTDPHVVLIDALDELRYRALGDTVLDWLIQCPELPANVRILLTSRPDREWLAAFRSAQRDRLVEEIIPDVDENVTRDLAVYAAKIAATPRVASFLVTRIRPKQSPEPAKDEFAAGAVEKAKGNLGYLAALGRAIDQAIAGTDPRMLEKLLELRQLPDTLQDLYGHFLKLIRQTVGEQSLVIEDPVSHEQALVKAWPNAYRPVLGVLAVAMEPLAPSQIRRLGRMPAGDDDVSDIVGRLRQFLDERGGRYTFYHSTLPEFLTSETTRQDAGYRELAVDPALWNGKIVASYRGSSAWDRVNWQTVDDYGLLHLAGHLHALRADSEYREQIYRLMCRPFMEEKLSRFHSHSSFSKDLDLAMQVAAADDSPASLVQLIRASLIYATLGTRATGVPPEVLGILARLGDASRAMEYAALIQDQERKCDTYCRIGEALLAQGKKEDGERAIRLAIAAAEAIQDEAGKASALGGVARTLSQGQNQEEAAQVANRALAAAESMGNVGETKAAALAAVAWAMAEAGKHEDAIKTVNRALAMAETIQEEADRTLALMDIARALGQGWERESLNRAVAVAETIQEESYKASALSALAPAMAQAGDKESVNRIVALTGTMSWSEKASAFIDLARATAQAGDQESFDRALGLVNRIQYEGEKASALTGIARAMAKAGDRESLNRALASAETIRDGVDKARALSGVAQAMAQVGDKENAIHIALRALAEAEASQGKWFRFKAAALSDVAEAMAQAGDKENAVRAANRALAVAESFQSDGDNASALGAVARGLAKAGDKKEAIRVANQALTAAEAIQFTWPKTSAMISAAQALAQAGDKEGAIKTANRALAGAERPFDKLAVTYSLCGAAQALAQAGDKENAIRVATRAVAAAESIPDEWIQAQALSAVAPAIAQAGDKESATRVASRAVALAQSEQNNEIKKAYALSVVVKGMAQAGEKERAIDGANRALMAAEAIQVEEFKALPLVSVAQALAEAGDKENAIRVGERALAAAGWIQDETRKADVMQGASQAMAQAGEDKKALQALKDAFWISRRSGREGVFKVLESGASVLALMGRGDTLRQVYEALQEVDSWWSAGEEARNHSST